MASLSVFPRVAKLNPLAEAIASEAETYRGGDEVEELVYSELADLATEIRSADVETAAELAELRTHRSGTPLTKLYLLNWSTAWGENVVPFLAHSDDEAAQAVAEWLDAMPADERAEVWNPFAHCFEPGFLSNDRTQFESKTVGSPVFALADLVVER